MKNKQLKDILNLFSKGERKFFENTFNLEQEIKVGHNFLKNNVDETLGFYINEEMDRVWTVEGTVPITGYQEIEFYEEDYGFGEVEYE